MANFLHFFSKGLRQNAKDDMHMVFPKYTTNVSRFTLYAFILGIAAFTINVVLSNNFNRISAIILVTYLLSWISIKLLERMLGVTVVKLLTMVLSYALLFTLDMFLGKGFGVYYYYFAIVVALLDVFHWKNERFDIFSHSIFLPVILIATSAFCKSFFFPQVQFNLTNHIMLYEINIYTSFTLVGLYIIWSIYKKSKLENKSFDLELNLTTLLSNSNGNIRTLNTSYEVIECNQGFKDNMKQLYNVDVKTGFNIQYELFAEDNFPVELKESHVKAMCGERVTTEYQMGNEYFELIAAPLEKDGEVKGVVLYDVNITEKKRKTFALKQSALDLKTLIDNTQGSIWSINNKYEVITANEHFIEEMKRLFQETICIGYNLENTFVKPTFPNTLKNMYEKVIYGETINCQYDYLGNFYEINARPLLNDHNEIIGGTFYCVNISENKFNEFKVDQLSLNLQSLIDNTNDSVWSIDSNYKLTAANCKYTAEFKEFFGIDVIMGFNIKNIFKHPNFPTIWKQYYENVLQGFSIEESYNFRDKIFKLVGKPIVKKGSIVGAAFFASDVTSSFKASQKIKQSQLNLQTLIDNNTGKVWGISNDYKILACNEMFRKEVANEYNTDITTGSDFKSILQLNQFNVHIKNAHTKVLNGERIVYVNEEKDKVEEITGVPIKSGDEVIGAAFFSEDITLKKKHEKALIDAKEKAEEASVTKARFLSNMSHELRTPLNGVIGITNILCDEEKLPGQQKNLDLLKYSSDLMYSIINDILDFSKIDEGKIVLEKTPFNLLTTIERTAVIFTAEAKKKGLDFTINAKNIEDLNIVGDVTRIRQVLNNLITNAIKFTDKGQVSFDVTKLTTSMDGKANIEFAIKDSGIGICADKLEHIFESFTQADVNTTRKYGGTGLGLTISKRLVDIMGGKLEVESKINEGSIFKFVLSFETPLEVNNQDVKMFRTFDNLRVLLAEDNRINMLVAKKQLEKWGIQVDEAENGEVAYNKFLNTNYDVILMDMEMPVMDGLTATAKIREVNEEIPIMALTAASFDNMHDFLIEKGLNGFIKKPFSPIELNKKIFDAVNTTIDGRVLRTTRVSAMVG